MAYTNWRVGDRIKLCCKVEDFCGAELQGIYLYSNADIQKTEECVLNCLRENCAYGCINTANREVVVKSVQDYHASLNDVNCANLSAEKIYRTLGSVRSDSRGVAAFYYTVTEQDRLDYLDAAAAGRTYDIVFCINDPLARAPGAGAKSFEGITVEQALEPPPPTHLVSLSVGFVPSQVINYFEEYIREISDTLMTKLPLLPSPWVYLKTTYDRAASAFNIWLYLPESATLSLLSPGFIDDLTNWLELYLPIIIGVISVIIGALLIAAAPPAGILYLIWGWTALMAGAALLAYRIYNLAQQVTVMQNTVDNQQIQLTNLTTKTNADTSIEEAWQKSPKTQSDCTTRLMAHAGSQTNFMQSYLDKYAKYVGLVTDLTAEKNAFTTKANSIIEEFKGKPYSESTCNDYYGRIMTESGASETRTQDIINKYVIKEEKYSVACKGWTNQAACEKAGCFWYNSACHQEEQCWISNPFGGCILSARGGKTIVGITAGLTLLGASYWLLTRKREEVISIYAGAREAAKAEAERAEAAYRKIRAPSVPQITGAPQPVV